MTVADGPVRRAAVSGTFAATAFGGDERPRVLLVHDDADVRGALAQLLGGTCDLAQAASESAALALGRGFDPDLVLAPTRSERCDGFALLASMRGDDVLAAAALVLLDDEAGDGPRCQDAIEAGADDCLGAPVPAGALRSWARAAKQLRRARVDAGRRESALRGEAQERARETGDARAMVRTLLSHGAATGHDLFRRMADEAPVLIWMSGTDKRCFFFNRPWLEFVGRSMEQEIGHGWTENVHPDDYARCLATYDGAFDRRERFAMEYRLRHRDGAYRWVLDNGAPIWDGGAFAGYVGSCVDITDRREAEQLLQARTELLGAIASTTTDLIFVKDAEGRLLLGNDALFAVIGEEARVLGRPNEEVLTPAVAAEIAANDRLVRETGETHTFEERLGAPGAERVWLATKSPYRDAEGRIAGIVGIARDITRRKQMEESLRRSELLYRGVGESIDFGIWTCDAQGRNTYASDSFLRLVGMTQEECSHFGWVERLHPDDRAATLAAWQECVRSGRVWDREHRILGVDGHHHPVLARGIPIRDESGELLCWAGINLDIARLKDAEAALREADRRKDEFLATLAHELRNPLAPIRNAVELLREGGADPDWCRAVIERQLAVMKRLVDDLLDVSRITRGQVELRRERVSLHALVEAAVETSRPGIEAGGHRVELQLPAEPIELFADPVRVTQCVANLLDNAAKHADRPGLVVVEACGDADAVTIRVRDQGPGLDEELLPQLFEPFARGRRTRGAARSGLGIGLSLVRSLVELHGGRVEARSGGPGLGSEFCIRLPRGSAEHGSEGGEGPPLDVPRASALRRVLVVDDNVDSAESLAMLVERLGFEVRTAHDGRGALAAADASRPDVVLLDIGLPDLSGYEVAQALRERLAGAPMRIVALTGWGQPEARERALAAGFDVHLVKPADLRLLREVLGV